MIRVCLDLSVPIFRVIIVHVCIALDKALHSTKTVLIFFFYFYIKTYIVSTHQKRLNEALLMSTHNICFHGEFFFFFFIRYPSYLVSQIWAIKPFLNVPDK